MRAIWSGGISFGLIYIPVKLYSGSQSSTIDLDLLHKKDMSPVGYAKICKEDGEILESEDIVKGFQYEKGKYVILDEKDFEEANPKRTKSINILNFIDADEIEPRYYEKPYLLEPEEADKTYDLFLEALKATKKLALGKYILRNREHLVIIEPEKNYLVMNQIRFPEELNRASELNLPKNITHEKEELQMATEIIEKMSKKFDPTKYKDTYNDELMDIISYKATHNKIKKLSDKPVATKGGDLMLRLKESLKLAAKH